MEKKYQFWLIQNLETKEYCLEEGRSGRYWSEVEEIHYATLFPTEEEAIEGRNDRNLVEGEKVDPKWFAPGYMPDDDDDYDPSQVVGPYKVLKVTFLVEE